MLLAELHLFGIQGVSGDWFRFCFTNRRQKVAINSPNTTQNFFSNWGTLKHGAPQGSILYHNRYYLPMTIVDFEDFCSLSNPVLSRIIKWFAANKLVLNLDKMIELNS